MPEDNISPEFPFQSHYLDVNGAKMHYVDEGSGEPILFLHGNPTSSYLWRNILPHLIPSTRCIAPDLIGMGKSDKPDIGYRFMDHVEYLDAFIEQLGLKNITLVIHDWGSALGFHYARRNPGNIKAIAMMEAVIMPIPSYEALGDHADTFRAFRTPGKGEEIIIDNNGFIEQVLPGTIVRDLTDEEMNVYRAPYLDPQSRRPLHVWPNEIPIAGEPADVHEAVASYSEWLQESKLPKLLFYASPGLIISPPVAKWCKENMPNLETIDIGEGIHFIQEDAPDAIGKGLADWHERIS